MHIGILPFTSSAARLLRHARMPRAIPTLLLEYKPRAQVAAFDRGTEVQR